MNKILFNTFSGMLLLLLFSCNASRTKDNSVNTDADASVKTGDIKDMVLIYNGGAHRTVVWNEEKFEPYVSAPSSDGKAEDWLFDGFLFLEIHDGTHSFASGYRPTPARKEHWIGLVEGYMTKGNGIRALDACIEKAKTRCKDPLRKRKIVMSLPEPIPNQKDWGDLDGRNLDFSNDEDRIAACKWYIDYIIRRFKEEKIKNVELSGFYWLAEEATNTRTFVGKVADYIHQKKFSFYWIPYFNSDGYNEWRSLGFDQAFLQPNHFFNDKIPDSRIDDACNLAKKLGMSVEMEFDENAIEGKGRTNRLRAYIDGFRRNNIFENTDVAYYQGDHAFYLLRNGNEKDKALYTELAGIIAKRQKALSSKKK